MSRPSEHTIAAGAELRCIHRDKPGSIPTSTAVTAAASISSVSPAEVPATSHLRPSAPTSRRSDESSRSRGATSRSADTASSPLRDLRLFDVSHANARSAYKDDGLDITAEIAAGPTRDDATPQRLARLVDTDNYDGIIYTARHDPGHSLQSVAVFGPAGAERSGLRLCEPQDGRHQRGPDRSGADRVRYRGARSAHTVGVPSCPGSQRPAGCGRGVSMRSSSSATRASAASRCAWSRSAS